MKMTLFEEIVAGLLRVSHGEPAAWPVRIVVTYEFSYRDTLSGRVVREEKFKFDDIWDRKAVEEEACGRPAEIPFEEGRRLLGRVGRMLALRRRHSQMDPAEVVAMIPLVEYDCDRHASTFDPDEGFSARTREMVESVAQRGAGQGARTLEEEREAKLRVFGQQLVDGVLVELFKDNLKGRLVIDTCAGEMGEGACRAVWEKMRPAAKAASSEGDWTA